MRAKFVGALSGIQFVFLLIQGTCCLARQPLHWGLVLIPLWVLCGIAVIFWLVVGVLWAKLGK